MHLQKVTLKNFRCFDHIEIDLHPQLTVFVAENGGGKTAVLDGIAVGLSPLLKYLSTANQRLSGPGIHDTDFRLVRTEGRGGKERWVASDYAQVVVEADNLTWDVWRPSGPKKQIESKIGQSALAEYAARLVNNLSSTEMRALLPVFAYYGARRGWLEVPKRIRESKINYEYPTSALHGCLESLSDFKEMLKWFDDAEATELRENKGCHPDDYDVFPPLGAVRATVQALLEPEFRHVFFDAHHKLVIESLDGILFQVSQLSQGYQSMLALGMDFARRLGIANEHLFCEDVNCQSECASERNRIALNDRMNPASGSCRCVPHIQLNPRQCGTLCAPSIMMIDEIDLHLHPSWQQRVLGDLMRAFPLTQFIVTTHSPQVLSTVDKESIRLLDFADGHVKISTPRFQTRGVESADVLAQIMGVSAVPPVKETEWLNNYRALIETDKAETEEAQTLLTQLTTHFGAQHPVILDLARLLRFQSFKRERPQAEGM